MKNSIAHLPKIKQEELQMVFTNYSPREHFLEILAKGVELHCPQLKNIFSKNSKSDKERFELLEYAYIGGRYDPEYKISEGDLKILEKEAKELLRLAGKACEGRIKDF